MNNLFENLPQQCVEELVDVLAQNKHLRLERIVSTGQASPAGFWYDQQEHEWIVILRGEAGLLFEGDEQPVHMQQGDHLLIPAHRKHRVEWTSNEGPTIWLALFFADEA